MTQKSPIAQYAAFACVYLGWGSLYFAIRIAVQSIPPLLLAGTSSVLAAAVLMLLSKAPRPSASEWKASFAPALFMIVLGNGLIVWAEQFVPSAITALLLATEPAWLILLDRVLFKGPKISRFQMAGIAMGILGVGLLLMADADPWVATSAARTDAYAMGLVAIVIAAAGWSLGSLMCRSEKMPKNSAMAIALPVFIGGVVMCAMSGVSGEAWQFRVSQVSAASSLAFVYIVGVCYVATYWSYVWLLKNVALAHVSTYAYVNPLIAAFLGVMIAGEEVSGQAIVGGCVIVAATFLILQTKKELNV